MILYSVTVNVEEQAADEWKQWMQEVHIPGVMSTGLFAGYRMFRVLSRFPDETGITFSIQYFLKDMEDYDKYRLEFAPALQREHESRYAGLFTAFRTLLEEI